MKAAGLIVLISVLVSTLSAQTTEPGEDLPPRVLRTAEMIGVRSQVEELVQLRSSPKRDQWPVPQTFTSRSEKIPQCQHRDACHSEDSIDIILPRRWWI